jgi:flagellar basal body rod protein FlgC
MALSFDPSISGAQATIARQNVAAQNVANLTTDGYEQMTPYQTDVVPGGTRISHVTRTPNSPGAPSNTDLAQAMVAQDEDKTSLQANLQVIKTKDRMLGDLMDIFA